MCLKQLSNEQQANNTHLLKHQLKTAHLLCYLQFAALDNKQKLLTRQHRNVFERTVSKEQPLGGAATTTAHLLCTLRGEQRLAATSRAPRTKLLEQGNVLLVMLSRPSGGSCPAGLI